MSKEDAMNNADAINSFEILLWDVDGTLLDFIAAEKAAMKKLFREFGLGECTDEMISRYSEINKRYWKNLELGLMTKQEILTGRFREFFSREGIKSVSPEDFNSAYQLSLGDTIVFCDNSRELVKALRGRIRQYAVSNGTVAAQTKKLRLSGLDRFLDGVFLSEDIGFEKPADEFFSRVFESIGNVNRDKTLIVGDSLTSDIIGGSRAGIKTCWYNPNGLEGDPQIKADYEITNLSQLSSLLIL